MQNKKVRITTTLDAALWLDELPRLAQQTGKNRNVLIEEGIQILLNKNTYERAKEDYRAAISRA